MIVNLISDTVTKPTKEMLAAMFRAEVGDDVFGEDPTINTLEAKMAELFGMEAALFVPSGTMANQIGIKALTQPLDEVICDKRSHIYRYELGGYGFHSGLSIQLLDGEGGKITAEQVESVIKPDVDWYPNSKLVSIENTVNMAGGNVYTLDELHPIREVCDARGLLMHLDGARLFNALVETGDTPIAYGQMFDSISVCFSKGLGAPVGSALISSADVIKKARKIRKVMGGGMRQAGYLAAACIHAIDHHVDRLKEDHLRAKKLSKTVAEIGQVVEVMPVKTNIIIFRLSEITANEFVNILAKHGIKAAPVSNEIVRFVLHLDVDDQMLEHVTDVLRSTF